MTIPLLPDYQFAAPAFLWLLLLLPPLAFFGGRRAHLPTIQFGALEHVPEEGHRPRGGLGGWTASFYLLALACGTVALARPQKLRDYEVTTGEGVEIALAIDVSFSMSIEDYEINGQRVNRLDAAKSVIKEFVDGRPTDRIGLVIFSGRPHTLAPLTTDHDWLKTTIDRDIHFRHRIAQATAIGTAIAASAKRLSDREAKSKIVVLLTDGDQNVPGLTPEDAARLAATLGIKVYPIAIGTPGRHYVPLIRGYLDQSFNLEMLEEVATITKAKSYQAKDTAALERIFAEIDSLEKSEVERRKVIETKEFFQWPAAAAALFALLGLAWEIGAGRVAPD